MNGDIMNGCLSIAGRDRNFLSVISHPKSTPTLKPRALQQVARRLNRQSRVLRASWQEIPAADREFWVNWASNDLPHPSVAEAVFGFVLLCVTLLNFILHRDDAIEVLTEGRNLRETILDLASGDVWSAALSDPDFLRASEDGFNDLAAGRVSVIARKDL